ncbi:MAG: glycosyltransferase [Roseimicrobium sp.]
MRLLVLNDVGFLGGAGIATRRQVQSLLMLGHEVMVLCHDPLQPHAAILEPAEAWPGRWLGLQTLPQTHRSSGIPIEVSTQRICAAVASAYPEAIILGNIHGAGWSSALLLELRRLRVPIIAYLHDLHFATGRCTHPYACDLHLTGCHAACPTASEYPPLDPQLIHGEWELRRRIFCGPGAAHAACNSTWTQQMFLRSLPQAASVSVLHLGLDADVFRPSDRSAARHALGIPQDKFVVLAAAMKFNDPHKGGPIFEALVRKLAGKMHFIALGGGADSVPVDQSIPPSQDAAFLAQLYAAADVFVSTSTAESFGQTLLEAAACARPVVSLKTGGIPDVMRHGETGLLVEAGTGTMEEVAASLSAYLQQYQAQPALAEAHGRAARQRVEASFTLEAQAQNWAQLLATVRDRFGL